MNKILMELKPSTEKELRYLRKKDRCKKFYEAVEQGKLQNAIVFSFPKANIHNLK